MTLIDATDEQATRPEDFPLPVIRGGYRDALDAAQPRVAEVVRGLLAGRPPALVHCHSGTGRTGLVAILPLEQARPLRRLRRLVRSYPASEVGHSEADGDPEPGTEQHGQRACHS